MFIWRVGQLRFYQNDYTKGSNGKIENGNLKIATQRGTCKGANVWGTSIFVLLLKKIGKTFFAICSEEPSA